MQNINVCIVGGGHIGTTLACYIKHTVKSARVRLFTRRPEKFSAAIKCNDIEGGFSYIVELDAISANPAIAAANADIVFVALPHFAVEKAFADIAPHVSPKAMIGVLPGGGGCEFIFHKYFKPEQTLFGFQRVPFTAKLQEYGREANLKSWKPYSVVGTIPAGRVEDACAMVEACGLKTKPAANFLEVALTPTNPILHTSRTHDLFGNHPRDHVFKERFKFYVGWTDHASETLFGMDRELHNLLDAISAHGIETDAIRPLSEHYESPTVPALTAKINGIPTFQTVYAPLKEVEGGYAADTSTRMFTEDFPWGLAVIRSYFTLFGVPAPTMDKVLGWYADYMGLEWYKGGKFTGKDLAGTGIIQNHGINSIDGLVSLYLRTYCIPNTVGLFGNLTY